MELFGRIQGVIDRLKTYNLPEVAVELVIIWVVVYAAYRFVRGTRAAGALKGLLVLLIIVTVVSRVLGGASFQRLGLLYDRFLALVAVALVVIFQPELRRALVRLGQTSLFRSSPKDITLIVNEVVEAAVYLAKHKFGALIVVERQVGLAGLGEGGTVLGAELSASLLQTIFFPGSALHDLAVIIKGRTIHAAGVQLPLADPEDMPDATLGSRHRAAVGLTRECDALVIVVSEETGTVRIAERGLLSKPLMPDDLRGELESRLSRSLRQQEPGAAPVPQAEGETFSEAGGQPEDDDRYRTSA